MGAQSKMLQKILPFLLGLASLLLMLHATGVYSRNTGLGHDALWDFEPAVGMLNAASQMRSQEIKIFGYPLPLVSGPYSGALKIWILVPLLLIFGTSPHVALILNVMFGFLYLLALYWALLPAAGGKWASLVFLLPLVDTNYLLTVPLDNGIFLTQYIFISLAIGALFRFLSNSQLKYYWMTWFFSGCLLAQKLTAIPIVISLVVTVSLLILRSFLLAARAESLTQAMRRFLAIPAALFLVPMAPQLYYFLREGFAELFAMTADGQRHPYFTALKHCYIFFASMFDGADWYQRVTLDVVPNPQAPSVLAILGFAVIACSLVVHLVTGRKNDYWKYISICTFLGVASFLLYPAFRGLGRPWHYYVLAPMFFSCALLAVAHLTTGLAIKSRPYATVVIAVFGVSMAWGCICGATRGLHILRRLETVKGVCVTSPALNETYAAIAASNIRFLYTLNYSLANPIYVFSKGSIHTYDLAWTDLTGDKIEELLQRVRTDPDAAIVYRFCGNKSVEPEWIEWLNREPQIFDFVEKLESEGDKVSTARFRDNRQGEFVLIRQGASKGPGGNASGQR